MIHSLRLKLLLMTLIVCGAAIAAVALFSSRATSHEFERYVETDERANLDLLRETLADHYNKKGNWDGVESALDGLARSTRREMILVGTDGHIITASPEILRKARIEFEPNDTLHIKIDETDGQEESGGAPRLMRQEERVLVGAPRIRVQDAGGVTRATLYAASINQEAVANKRAVFVSSVNRSLMLAVALAGAVAFIAAIVFSRRILRPVEALTLAARRMESGDLGQRVEVASKDEIGVLAQSFNRMADSLARVEELRRQMVGDIAHELRTPVTNIRCQLEAIEDGLLKASPDVMASLREEVIMLGRLIDDLQDLALAEAGQLRLNEEEVRVKDEIETAASALRPQANEKQIALEIIAPDDLPSAIADRRRIKQVVTNLLNNALTHTPPGGLVKVSAEASGVEIKIAVEDTGPGIAPEHASLIFERFYRVDGSRARATGGAGLGLAIVKQLVSAHGGRVWVESRAGHGSCFFFTLPINK